MLHSMNPATQPELSGSKRTSPLVEKARRLGLELPLDLERLAMLRGCNYYERELPARVTAMGDIPLSNAELAVGLVVPSLSPTTREIRLAAAVLGAPDVRADEVAALAMQEGCADVIRYIALCGKRYEPGNVFWSSVLGQLPDTKVDSDLLPHPTRFVEMTGIDREQIGVFTRWIRPRLPATA